MSSSLNILAEDFDNFVRYAKSCLNKIKSNSDLACDDLNISESQEFIVIKNFEDGKIVSTIVLPKNNDDNIRTFYIQISDSEGKLKGFRNICVGVENWNNFERIPGNLTEEERTVFDVVFNKIKCMSYGIRPKESLDDSDCKKKALIR